MDVVITFRPRAGDPRATDLLEMMQRRVGILPSGRVGEDGIRHYHVDWPNAGLDALDSELDKLDPYWRYYLECLRDPN